MASATSTRERWPSVALPPSGNCARCQKPLFKLLSAKPLASKFGNALAASMAAKCCCPRRRNPFPAKPPSKAALLTRNFSAHQAVRLTKPTNDERELLAAAKDLFTKLFTRRVAVRLAGVSVHNLEIDKRQHELFDTNANRRWYLNRGLDSVRGRYGWNAVFYGKGLELREHYATKPNGLVLSPPCLSR